MGLPDKSVNAVRFATLKTKFGRPRPATSIVDALRIATIESSITASFS